MQWPEEGGKIERSKSGPVVNHWLVLMICFQLIAMEVCIVIIQMAIDLSTGNSIFDFVIKFENAYCNSQFILKSGN